MRVWGSVTAIMVAVGVLRLAVTPARAQEPPPGFTVRIDGTVYQPGQSFTKVAAPPGVAVVTDILVVLDPATPVGATACIAYAGHFSVAGTARTYQMRTIEHGFTQPSYPLAANWSMARWGNFGAYGGYVACDLCYHNAGDPAGEWGYGLVCSTAQCPQSEYAQNWQGTFGATQYFEVVRQGGNLRREYLHRVRIANPGTTNSAGHITVTLAWSVCDFVPVTPTPAPTPNVPTPTPHPRPTATPLLFDWTPGASGIAAPEIAFLPYNPETFLGNWWLWGIPGWLLAGIGAANFRDYFAFIAAVVAVGRFFSKSPAGAVHGAEQTIVVKGRVVK